jgi:hypothetical protein
MMGGRGVLLDHEDAGADAADGELLVTLDARRLAGDGRSAGRARAAADEVQKLLDASTVAFGVDEQAAVVAGAHPSGHRELASASDGGFDDPLAVLDADRDGADRRVLFSHDRASCGSLACRDFWWARFVGYLTDRLFP